MSTTLTNGLKLPDKGSVDWYSDMQNNYTILDGAVGTIAEHTTALAGKAPAVHTHTKSDITDLFNSANTWSALNAYSNGQIRIKSQSQEIGVIPSSSVIQYLEFADKNDAQHGIVGLWDYAGGASEIQMRITDKFKNGTKDPTGTTDTTILSFGFKTDGSKFLTFSGQVDNSIIPLSNNLYNLGSSTNQWWTISSRYYYYNGTAWGLDKSNVWSQINDFKTLRIYGVASNNLVAYPPSGEKGDSSTFGFNIICSDKNLGNYAASGVANIGMGQSNGTSYVALNASTKGSTDNNIHLIQIGLQIAAADNANIGSFYPTQNGGINLGTSDNKWKSLNGINPGALSLPNLASDGYIDLSDNISVNTEYSYTPTADGWLALYVQTTGFHAENAVGIFTGGGSSSSYRWACSVTSAINLPRAGRYHGAVMLPVKAGIPYLCWITIDSSTTLSAKRLYFYKATGNV